MLKLIKYVCPLQAGETPIVMAAKKKESWIVALLLAAGAHFDKLFEVRPARTQLYILGVEIVVVSFHRKGCCLRVTRSQVATLRP